MARLVVVCRVRMFKVKKFIGTIWKGTPMRGWKRRGKQWLQTAENKSTNHGHNRHLPFCKMFQQFNYRLILITTN